MIDPALWDDVRRLTRSAFATSLHFSLSTIGADGSPAVTPIGSLCLLEPGRACYLEFHATGLGHRLDADPRVSILAVDSSRLRWLRALLSGRFARRPAVRLVGRADGPARPATEQDLARFTRQVALVRALPGGRKLWQRNARVRELRIERIDEVGVGPLTRLQRAT